MPTVETDSFRLKFPQTWSISGLKPRCALDGPEGQHIEISSVRISGGGKPSDHKAVKDELRANIQSTFAQMPADGSCEPRTELQKYDSPGSEEFYQQLFLSADGTVVIGVFGLLNLSSALLATFEAPAIQTESLVDVANVLDRIEWLDSAPVEKPSSWKFWK